MYYSVIKLVHMSCVALSVSLFAARGLWLLASERPLWRWLRVAPHLIDTLLLASGLTLAFLIHQFPFVNSDWLTAKVIGLIFYIVLGVAVFRASAPRAARWSLWVLAILVFGYIVSVAVTKDPAGFAALVRG
ncbi:MAG TPA: SirB2 family protein [Gammaproteobacteria bacterium]|nr:SirB2 family protein [Gammaproteobacteria bacterium]